METYPNGGQSLHLRKGGEVIPVPFHGAKEVGTGLQQKLIKDMELK